ncbi:MAG: ATP-binding protein [Acidobacteria bacterium]|nr:ATP-binding protein [Acidobacteriota bacterium]
MIFLCAEYATKRWCKLEWRFIRQLVATLEAERIMFLSFGDPGDLSQMGILSGDGYLEIGDQSAEVIAEKIGKRFNLNRGVTAPAPTVSIPADISRIVKYAPAELIGREAETRLLDDAWAKVQSQEAKRSRILTFVALGGEGKTSLVAKWAADLSDQNWPGCDAVFAWSFYSQGTREQLAASSDLFLAEALSFFGDTAMAGSNQGAFEKGRRLAQLVGERRSLLILDGLEPLQYAPTSPTAGELKDQGLAALLKGLAANSRGLCVVTTRYKVPDLRAYWQTAAPQHELPRLSTAAGVRLLRTIGVKGTQAEFEKLVEDVNGHALTLQILGQFLVRAHHGDIRRRDRVNLEKADAKIQGGHAFRAMAAYVKWLEDDSEEARRELAVLQLMGLFDRPAAAELIDVLRQPPAISGLTEPVVGLAEEDWELSLSALGDARLLTVNRDAAGNLLALDAHPLLREYFAGKLKAEGAMMNEKVKVKGERKKQGKDSSFIPPNSAFQEAHRRLYEHLCVTTKEGDEPTLEDLQPLYQAVAHGSQAGLQQEALDKVYYARILRGNEGYSAFKLGALGSDLGAVACFFETPWSRVSPVLSESDQAWLLGDAAFRLRALGRLAESLEPMRAGLEMGVKQENWREAARRASNLSELELTLGLVDAAERDAAQSVEYADRSGDAFQRMTKRVRFADILHQAGRRAEAEGRFREAEQMQAEDQSDYPLLYSLQGFQYCDLLLAEAEMAAWKKRELGVGRQELELSNSCRAVSERATQTLKIAEECFGHGLGLLDIALDHLTLSRAALYQAILESSISQLLSPNSQFSISHIEQAVSGLRRAGRNDHLPRALLTRAWLRSLTGARTGSDSPQEDLDEAWEIAERGAMKLHLADIHLYRARLFGLRNADGDWRSGVPYPWESPEHDLAEAERLIKECGYHRRDEELEDAKRAILGEGSE